MNNQQRRATAIISGVIGVLGIFATLASAENEPRPNPEQSRAVANRLALKDGANADTQLPPGTVGKNWPAPVEDSLIYHTTLFDLLEYRGYSAGPSTLTWDAVGWLGGDYNRLWLKSEGDQNLSAGRALQGDLQLLYGRLIAPYWDFQAGVRYNRLKGPNRAANSRTYLVIGLQGLATQRFDVEPTLYLSDRGEVSAEITVSIDYFLTQRLILQPRFEAQVSVQGDGKFDTASGANQTDIGLRLRYEMRREFAPYVGITWLRKYSGTASIARSQREPADTTAWIAGVRLAF